MPKLQTGCTLTATGRDGREDGAHVREGGGRPERDARVHPRQPSARLPGLRQGRRVPAAGSDLPLRAWQHADELREADVREADPDLADDLARPRALHPLLPLHALQLGRERGRAARRREPRRDVGDHDVRGCAVHGRVHRQRHRALPGRRAPADAVPLRGPAVGDRRRADRLRPLPRRLQHRARPCARGRSSGSSRATIPRSTRAGSATRAASRSRTCTPRTGSPAPRRGRPRGLVGRRDRRGRAASARRARPHRHRALRLRDGRAGVRARQAPARRARLARGDAAGGGLRRARRLPPAALRDSRRRRGRRPRRRAGRRARAGRRSLDQGRAAATAPGSSIRVDGVGEAERVVLVWSGPGGHGGATVAQLAEELGLAGREGCGAFYLPATPNGRGVADAWAACCDEEGEEPESIGVLVVSGDEAAANDNVRALAEQAEATIVISMFELGRGLEPRPPPARARATSSATARSSTSRGACSACAAR